MLRRFFTIIAFVILGAICEVVIAIAFQFWPSLRHPFVELIQQLAGPAWAGRTALVWLFIPTWISAVGVGLVIGRFSERDVCARATAFAFGLVAPHRVWFSVTMPSLLGYSWTVFALDAITLGLLVSTARMTENRYGVGRRRRWLAAGRCGDCGYDLRASGEICPECGASRATD